MPKKEKNIDQVRIEIAQAKHQPSVVNTMAKALGMGTTADALASEQVVGDGLSARSKALKDAMEAK